MGGRIALHVALALGAERVSRLVLIGASPGLADDGQRAERVASDEALATELEGLAAEVGPERAIEEFAQRWASGTPVLAGQPPRCGRGCTPIGCGTHRPGWRGRCGGSEPGRYRRCGIAWAS